MIKKVKIFANNNVKANTIKCNLENKLKSNGFILSDSDYDLGIAVGGDGSFLRMIRSTDFDSSKLYIGVNAGTLGFAQEVNILELDEFIDFLRNNKFKIEEIGAQEVSVYYKDKCDKFYALNEVTIRDNLLNTTKLEIKIEDKLFENFVGDGILISTSFGSTAYNLSFGGSIIYNTLHTLQITPIAPLNSKVYNTLVNSIVIPQNKVISVIPCNNKTSLIITIDGENYFYDDVKRIETCVKNKRIKCLRKEDYNFIDKVNEKFLR